MCIGCNKDENVDFVKGKIVILRYGYGCSPETQTRKYMNSGAFALITVSTYLDSGWLSKVWDGSDISDLVAKGFPTLDAGNSLHDLISYLEDPSAKGAAFKGDVVVDFYATPDAENKYSQTLWLWFLFQVLCLCAAVGIGIFSGYGFYMTWMYKRSATLALVILFMETLAQVIRVIWLIDPFQVSTVLV
jgi:hypothetical protein